MQAFKHPSTIIIVVFALIVAVMTTLDGGDSMTGEVVVIDTHSPVSLSLAPESILPQTVLDYADERTIEAYRFAAANPELLTHQPCYCGCNMIHDSNEACFIQDITADGSITFDMHAVSCGVCVDIALDVKRLTEEGWEQLDIRHYIDESYVDVGPATDTEMPES
jgi:hypothetical protein